MAGIAEAILYAMRLYGTIIQPGSRDHDTHQRNMDSILSFMHGYDSDPLMRALPKWLPLLRESAELARGVLPDTQPDGEFIEEAQTCKAYYGPRIESLYGGWTTFV